MDFTEVLEELRQKRQLSKKDLAARAGLSVGYISLLTRGGRNAPSEKTVNALADALNLDEEARTHLFRSAGLSYPSSDIQIVSPQQIDSDGQKDGLTRQDWGDAPNVQAFYGREEELTELKQWILSGLCRMVAVLGLGGIGKTMLTAKLARDIAGEFDFVFWRSLKDAPHLESVLEKCVLFLSNQQRIALPGSLEDRILVLIKYLREHRCLLILDNVESILQSGEHAGEYQKGYEEYGKLIKMVGSIEHQSCLILTSREKLNEVALLEGITSPVRLYQLEGLKPADGWKILKDKGVLGDEEAQEAKELVEHLVNRYAGNPLALKVAAELIRDVFAGDIAKFLRSERLVFSDLQDVLNQQFERLSELEREIMYWLAIEREPVLLDELSKDLVISQEIGELLKALQSLKRRSLIETGQNASYTLQPAIMEYVLDKFIKQICEEIDKGIIGFFESHALIKAQAKDYVRESQVRLIFMPIAQQLIAAFGREGFEEKLKYLLSKLPKVQSQKTGYAAGNILNFLIQLEYDLSGYDFSHLYVWEAYLQGVTLTDVNFSCANLERSVFTNTFRSILSVALSPNDALLAAGTENGEVRLWDADSGAPLRTYQGHTGRVRAVAFSPDGKMIVSGSEDQTVRLWSVDTGQCLNILQGHTDRVRTVAFDPHGDRVISGCDDHRIRVWDVQTGQCLQTLTGHTDQVRSAAFNKNGDMIVSGSDDRMVLVWDAQTGQSLKVLEGHTGQVHSVDFSPDGTLAVSGSQDHTVRVWEVETGHCLGILEGHTNQVRSVAFNASGDMIVSGSDDQTVRLWDMQSGHCLKTLQGHIHRVYSAIFGHGKNIIVSGSEDQTLRIWDIQTGECLKTLQGYINQVRSVDFDPSGSRLISGGDDQLVRLWDVQTGHPIRILRGHTNGVRSVSFSPKGTVIASGSDDRTARTWDAQTGNYLQVLRGHTERVRAIAFSSDGTWFASGSEDQTVRIWDVQTGQCLHVLKGHTDWVRTVAFSPDGARLVSGSEDQTVRIWDVQTGECLKTLHGHTNGVRSVSFSPDGKAIVSSSDDRTIRLWETATGNILKILEDNTRWILSVDFSPDGTKLASGSEDRIVRIWDVQNGQCLKRLHGHEHRIYSVVFNPSGGMLASSSLDGMIKLWEVETGECLRTLTSNKPYERMNITNVQGLTDTQRAILKALGAIED